MSYKRSRSTFEASGHAPYVLFGTPLPEESERDDNSYLPVWKQDVRDERGRKRLHGAFTGGWSAGYFNTVGSKEGWTPSTFVSSRNNRRKDDARTAQQRAEDYMDDEDLADAAESQRVQTSEAFAGLGDSSHAGSRKGGLLGLFRAEGDTMGYKLLRRMGWKTGQGIGPRIKRVARLDDGNGALQGVSEVHSFAPANVAIVSLGEKTDKKGLGFVVESKLSTISNVEEEMDGDDDRIFSSKQSSQKDSKRKSGIGIGVLNDTGSDDEDVYEMGPKISYSRTVGGDKKKKKTTAAANPALKNAPVFMSKSSRLGGGLRRCHDGKLPLDGFILARAIDDLTSRLAKFAPPSVPEGWKSALSAEAEDGTDFKSTADAAKESTLNPKARAAILGEKALPGKSVFDFLSTTVRDQLVSASGNAHLPPARGELPKGHGLSDANKKAALTEQTPMVDRDAAIAAIARGSKGPYADNDDKRARYKAYLDHVINSGTPLPDKLPRTTDADFVKEMTEYYNCARIFKPMTGFMASRFTTAKSTAIGSTTTDRDEELISKPTKKEDPAEEAAKVGMYGALTRTISDFYPTRLLCKRFNVRGPDPAPQDDGNGAPRNDGTSTPATADGDNLKQQQLLIQAKPEAESPAGVVIDPSKNDALEGNKASADVLAAIFGDSDDDE